MKKRLLTLLAVMTVIAAGLAIYAPRVSELGLYRDDWNNFYNAVIRGPQMMVEHYASDRPADGWLIGKVFSRLGTDYTAYHLLNLFMRLAGCVFLTLTLCRVWPKRLTANILGGILCVIFPGFLQQIDGIAYVPHQMAMLCFCLSLWLTVVALQSERLPLMIGATLIALALTAVYMILMEYYLGMEAYRFALIYLLLRRGNSEPRRESFCRALLRYLPYVIALGLFVVWRGFFFDAKRAGADVMGEVITPLLSHPRYAGLTLLSRLLKNFWKLFIGVWTVPVYNLLNGTDMKSFWADFLRALPCVLFCAVALCFARRREDATDEPTEFALLGLLSGAAAILPMVLANRDINFASSLDRFSWVGMLGTVWFLIGVFARLKPPALRVTAVLLTLLTSAFVQTRNITNCVTTWRETQDYWQQLLWRAPGLTAGTTLVTSGAFSAEEDYEIFAPANLIYFPTEGSYAPIGAEILNTGTVRDIEMGAKTMRTVRAIYVEKDYQQLLALTKPTAKSCVQVIDGAHPIYSQHEWSKIPEVGRFSKLEQIDMLPAHYATPPFFLGAEQSRGWCYYYEKISLALQQERYEDAAALADQAAAAGLRAEDYVEWVPVVEAYTRVNRFEDAEQFLAILSTNDYLKHQACRYFRGKSLTAPAEVLCQ